MSPSSEVLGRPTSHARTRRVISLCAAMLLPAACKQAETAASSEPMRTTTASTPPPASSASAQGGSSRALELIVPPDEGGNFPVDLWVRCRSGPHFQISDLGEIVPLAEGDPGGVSEAIQSFLRGGEGRSWPQADWLLLRQTKDEVLLVHLDPGGLSFLNVERAGGAWRWSGSQSGGPCPLYYVVPDGLHEVDWRLDPKVLPNPSATTLEVLITERECASGQQLGKRLRGPQIVMTGDALRIAFAAVPPSGDAFTCPSNPETHVTVELPAPVGDREIIEGLGLGIHLEDYLAGTDTRRR